LNIDALIGQYPRLIEVFGEGRVIGEFSLA
jgi:hypothetical protein